MRARQINARFHLADGLGEADEDRPADNAVADIELFHALESRDGSDVLVIEAVPRMEFQTGGEGGDGRGFEGIELAAALGSLRRVGITAGVQLDSGDAQLD